MHAVYSTAPNGTYAHQGHDKHPRNTQVAKDWTDISLEGTPPKTVARYLCGGVTIIITSAPSLSHTSFKKWCTFVDITT